VEVLTAWDKSRKIYAGDIGKEIAPRRELIPLEEPISIPEPSPAEPTAPVPDRELEPA
jgi:hypothetical protein